MKKFLVLSALVVFFLLPRLQKVPPESRLSLSLWPVQSIDTMKFSRDLAREKLNDPSFDSVIDAQVQLIAKTGATHVAVATPYDAEFLPFLRRWVAAARRYNLKVWFRGNWSGWESWFDYPRISRPEHLQKTRGFIISQPDLFADGDIFSSCPECENGGPGDPRRTQDVAGFRQFLIDLYTTTSAAFARISKDVKSNYFSQNGDVAKLVMDKATTTALGGMVVVDHYVSSPQKLVLDIETLADSSGGQVVLGEFGVPIPDIHGPMSPQSQSAWLSEAMTLLSQNPRVQGVNYWTSFGGTTRLWDESGQPRPAAQTISSFFSLPALTISVRNALGQAMAQASASFNGRRLTADNLGRIKLGLVNPSNQVTLSAPGYRDHGLVIDNQTQAVNLTLEKLHENVFFKALKLIRVALDDILRP